LPASVARTRQLRSPYPSRPSGERPCCTCIRNPEREKWGEDKLDELRIIEDDHGNARCFDPFAGFAYNGAPYVRSPMDNYVTLDQRDQERFYETHPDYGKPIQIVEGKPVIVE